MGGGGDSAAPARDAAEGGRQRVRLPGSAWGSPLGRDLPRGRHGFPLDEVSAYQRVRLLDAFVAEVGRVGFAAARVATVCAEAGTSTKAFYGLFDSKDDCLLRAFEAGAKAVCDQGTLAYRRARGPWAARVTVGVQAMLQVLADNPPYARLALVELGRLGPTGAARLEAVAAYCMGRFEAAPPPAVPAALRLETYRAALVAAAVRVLGDAVLEGSTDRLPELAATLGDWLAAWSSGTWWSG